MKPMPAVCLLLVALLPLPGAADTQWALAKETQGIRVYTQPVAGSAIDAFRGEVLLPGDATAIEAIMRDVAAWPEWMHRTTEAAVLARLGEDEQISYSVNHFPWPARDRLFIVHSRQVRDHDTGTTTLHLSDVDKEALDEDARQRLPDSGRYVPIDSLSGSWRFREAGHGCIALRYELHVEVGGALPAGMVNRLIVDTPLETLRALRERLRARDNAPDCPGTSAGT